MRRRISPPCSEFERLAEALEAALAPAHSAAHSALRRALVALQNAYARRLNPWGRSWAARAIASLPDGRRSGFLRAELDAPVWRVRMICVRALGKRPDSWPLLLGTLHGPQWRVRDAAARALGRAEPGEPVFEALEAMLDDADERVVATAERLLDRLWARQRGKSAPDHPHRPHLRPK